MRKIILVTALFSLLASFAIGQCPTAGFSAPDSVCAGSTFQVTNTSTGGFSNLWDFCGGDLKTVPQTSYLSQDGALNLPQQLRLVNDNGTYYLFVANLLGGNLLRFDFGNSVNNIPVLFDYGNIGGLFNLPAGLDIVNDNGTWFALISNIGTQSIARIDFGSTISTNTATGVSLGGFNLMTPRGVKIAKDGTDYFAFISNADNHDLTKISFGNSIGNVPSGFSALTDPIFDVPWGFDVAFDCSLGKWVGFYASNALSKIHVIDFGTSLTNPGTVTSSITSTDNPSGINLVHEGDSWYIILNSFNSGNPVFQKIRLSGDLLSTPADLTTHVVPQNTSPRNVTTFHDSTGLQVFIANNSGNSINKLFFSSPCSTVPSIATSPSTVDVSTTINNNYQVITLNVTSANGLTSYYTDSIYINEAPQAGFVYSTACEGQSVSFTDTSILNPNLTTTWSWDFGDASPLDTNQNPVHLFPGTNTYNVTLTATYPSGCFTTFSNSIFVAPNPIADFSFLNNQCSFTEVSFSDLSQAFAGTVITSWAWNFGDTLTDSIQNPVHIYTTAGSFDVVLTVTTDAGCTDSVMLVDTILPSPETDFTVVSTCIGDSAQFDNATIIQSGIQVNYHWDFGDSDTSLLESPSHLYPVAAANYDVTLIATAINGCSDTLMQNIRISNKPVAGFTWTPTVVCQGNSVNFTSTSFGTGGDTISTYVWDFSGGNFSNDMNPIFAFGDTGYYDVTLTVLSPTYCDSSVTQQVYVIPSPTASFTATGVCLGLTTIFNPSTTTPPNTVIDSIVWTFGDGNGFSGLTSPVHLYDTAGKFPVTMTVYNNFGCTGTFEDSVDVYPIPTAAFTYSTLCTDSLAFFDGTSSTVINDSLTSWLWNFDNQGSGIGSTTSFTFADSGTFDVTLVVTSMHGCSDTTMQSIQVIQSPEFDFIFNEPCSAQVASFAFIPVDPNAPAVLTWDFGDGSSISGILSPQHPYTSVDTFLVCLRVVHNQTGCASKLCKNLVVNPYPDAGFTFVNNCEGLPIQFTDTSTIESGTLNTWAWNFGTLGISNNQNPAVISQNPGNFPVILSVTSTAGCITTANDSFTVFSNPVAAFMPDPVFGSPPLNVNFVNNTTGATSYAWNFGNNTTGIGFSPNVTYVDTGTYQISLVATSSEGCIDSTSEILSVLFPYLDIAVNKVFATQTGTFLGLKAEIINLGNIPVTHFQIGGKIDNETAIVETWLGQLQPGGILNYQFNASLLIDVESPPGFFCVEVSDPNFLVDEVPENNSLCDVLGKSFELYTAYPNPFTENLSIAFNLPDEDFYNIQIYDAIGKLVYESLNQEGLTGYNQVNISTINFRKGIYVLKLDYRDKNITMNLLRY